MKNLKSSRKKRQRISGLSCFSELVLNNFIVDKNRESFANGEKPDGYNYADVPLLDDNFINETHVKVGDEIIAGIFLQHLITFSGRC